MMTKERLLELYGETHELAIKKVIHKLDKHSRDFIKNATFLVLGTGDGTDLDVSPKGDPAGFVAIEDDTHLLLPDRPGNNRLDGMLNLLKFPKISLLLMIPTVDETLRINGTATIHEDPELLERCALKGRLPTTVLRIAIEEIFLHCGKAPLRSGLWRPDTWPTERPVGTLFEILRDQAETEVADTGQDAVDETYRRSMY